MSSLNGMHGVGRAHSSQHEHGRERALDVAKGNVDAISLFTCDGEKHSDFVSVSGFKPNFVFRLFVRPFNSENKNRLFRLMSTWRPFDNWKESTP